MKLTREIIMNLMKECFLAEYACGMETPVFRALLEKGGPFCSASEDEITKADYSCFLTLSLTFIQSHFKNMPAIRFITGAKELPPIANNSIFSYSIVLDSLEGVIIYLHCIYELQVLSCAKIDHFPRYISILHGHPNL